MKKVWFGILVGIVLVSYALLGRSKKPLTEEEIKSIEQKLEKLEAQQATWEEKHHALLQRQRGGTEKLEREIDDALYRLSRIQEDIAALSRRKKL
jgi:hypothetical protein